jgi:hypothetical protein
MKTKKLIEILQKADPDGNLECVVDGKDIYDIEINPGYWDGPYEILERDEECEYYNVRGAKITTKGFKLEINTLSIENAIWNSDAKGGHLPVEIDTTYAIPERNQQYRDMVEEWRKEAREFYENKEKKEENP